MPTRERSRTSAALPHPAPLPNLRDALACRAAVFGPVGIEAAPLALEYARREVHQFHVVAVEDIGDDVCPGDRLVLHLLDGAIGVLRQALSGGVA